MSHELDEQREVFYKNLLSSFERLTDKTLPEWYKIYTVEELRAFIEHAELQLERPSWFRHAQTILTAVLLSTGFSAALGGFAGFLVWLDSDEQPLQTVLLITTSVFVIAFLYLLSIERKNYVPLAPRLAAAKVALEKKLNGEWPMKSPNIDGSNESHPKIASGIDRPIENAQKNSLEMNPEYFKTQFSCPSGYDWPPEFVIVSAYATTGEKWTEDQNADADAKLQSYLASLGVLVGRVVGFSPETDHAEPSWAAKIGFDAACDIGQRFRQDAIYYVQGDTLFVSHCDDRRKQIEVGPFRGRVQ